MNLAVIPARSGSKRIPHKNIKSFLGKPMISYAIKVAMESGLFDRIVVSTDDQKIAEIANEFGAETPFLRPDDLADDYTPTVAVVAHAIAQCCSVNSTYSHVCCIYPCVPFLTPADFVDSLEQLKCSGAKFCFPVTEYAASIYRALRMDHNGFLLPIDRNFELTRTQDIETTFHDAGQFYWGTTESWLTIKTIHSHAIGYKTPKWRTIDIDTPDDWCRAELIYTALYQGQ
jgi:pseudaminic acid cytidylyltransferase